MRSNSSEAKKTGSELPEKKSGAGRRNAETPGEAALPYTKEEVEKLQKEILRLAAYWEPLMGVHCTGWQLREMKTRWGSCTVQTGKIRLNLSLARKPEACLEYVLVHELCHLLEPSHNARFHGLMDKFLPDWRERKLLLNQK
ncbi:MAG: M48 family metallopeptidase [Lachnospiraceae bacterium]